MRVEDRYWLAGLLEGEGSFMHGPPSAPWQPVVAVQMTDRDVVERVAKLLDLNYIHRRNPRGKGHKETHFLCIRGANAIALMQSLRPLMGARRAQRIDEVVERYNSRPRSKKPLTDQQVTELRLINGDVSVSELARRYGISRTHVRRLKRGVRH